MDWLGAEDARLVIVLGDFGRGKTSFLRQLTRTLPAELPGLLPILVELRGLEKAPTLDELLSQYLVRQGVEDINPAKLRYMIHSGRVGLLFDGFDELELRVGYDNAADYLQVLLDSVTGRAKVVLTSRTQHFRSTEQVKTALGDRISALAASRLVVLEDFSEEQILAFLTNLFGDKGRARMRLDLLRGIGNLLELARNPRMLAFVAEMDETRLWAVQGEEGQISAAGLYREIIDYWLTAEARRQQYRHGLPSLGKDERLSACTALALRLWASRDYTIALNDLSAEVSATLTGLAERGYTEEQASHSIGSGSLLVRTEDGAFAFVHQSIMEWLVADAAARDLGGARNPQILTTRRMSRLMTEFFADLAGHPAARTWAAGTLADPEASHAAKQNALSIMDRAGQAAGEGQNLAGVDLRGQDLTGRNLHGANLRGANLARASLGV
ncbi:MAG TPA: NACHT domain-containing protein, partial [Streptosporangiaceae bacterium]